MKSFDNFQWLSSLKDVENGMFPYDDSSGKYVCNFYDKLTINILNYDVVRSFYNKYIRKFGHNFIAEKASCLNSTIVKRCVMYALEKYKDVVEIENARFESDLEDVRSRLNIEGVDLMDVFEKYLPFIHDRDIYRFAYDNIDSPQFDYFYLLLIWFYEHDYPVKPLLREYQTCKSKDECKHAVDCKIRNVDKCICLYDEDLYGKDYSFIQELNDFQKEIIVKFLHFAPKKIKDKALVKLYESFKQINQTNLFEEKLSLSFDKFLCNKDNPLTGEFYLPWSKVEFYNGFYLISHPNASLDKRSFYRIEDRNSRKVFNDINKLFLKRLFPIYVKAEKGQIVKVLNNANLRECISILEHKINITFTKKECKDRAKVEKRELTISEAKDLCKELKSRYLDNLCVRQLENYKVICCIEHRINSSGVVHDEYSFIFTVKESKEKIYIVYENAANSRSTYILPIARGTWGDSINHIYNFFASDEVNKRQQMASRLVDLKLPGKYEYKRVFHTDYYSWNCKIRELLMDAKDCL